MIKLEKMTHDQFHRFQAVAINNYADALSKSKVISVEDAKQISKNEFDAVFTEGLNAPPFFVVNSLLLGTHLIGFIWYGVTSTTATIYDIFIYKRYRNKGYGTEALSILQGELKKQHIKYITLNVFSHNQGAIDFYQKHKFTIDAYTMIKKIT